MQKKSPTTFSRSQEKPKNTITLQNTSIVFFWMTLPMVCLFAFDSLFQIIHLRNPKTVYIANIPIHIHVDVILFYMNNIQNHFRTQKHSLSCTTRRDQPPPGKYYEMYTTFTHCLINQQDAINSYTGIIVPRTTRRNKNYTSPTTIRML